MPPSANVIPPDWQEVPDPTSASFPDPTDPALIAAVNLLLLTHTGRYEHLKDMQKLVNRMKKLRDIGSGNKVRGLRAFAYKYDAGLQTVQIAAFFFLRLKVTDIHVQIAYCMTVGADCTAAPPSTVTPAVIYQQLQKICKYMQAEPVSVALEIINSERHLKHIGGDSIGAAKLVAAYFIDQPPPPQPANPNALVTQTDSYEAGYQKDANKPDPATYDPWFPTIHRWKIGPVP